MIFNCDSCGQSITVQQSWAGKKGRCPKCQAVIVIPPVKSSQEEAVELEAENSFPELEEKVRENEDSGIFDFVEAERRKRAMDAHIEDFEKIGNVSRSWIVEILLYPKNSAGLAMLAVFIMAPAFLELSIFLFNILPGRSKLLLIPLLVIAFIVYVIVSVYIFWYFSLCIQQSALGSAKAPETLMDDSSFWEMTCKMIRFFSCMIICLGPAAIYFYRNEVLDAIFYCILAGGVFFLPMALMATTIFDSVAGLNPVLIIRSIIKVFKQYTCVVLIYCVFVGLIVVPKFTILTIVPGPIKLVWHGVYVYFMMVMGHILGRLYYRNSEKLNWEV